MTSNVTHVFPNNPPDKTPETVEKDVRKWVESISEYKANLDMEKCEVPPPKKVKKVRKTKTKKKQGLRSEEDNKTPKAKADQKSSKPKVAKKKDSSADKMPKEAQAPPSMSAFDTLKDNYKNLKLPPNWVSGQSRGKLIFCRVKVVSNGSQYEMVSDRGVAITNDCIVHVFIDGPEIILRNWKMQRVESIEDIRKAIKAVDGFKVCSGALPNGMKSPSCSIFLTGETKTCQACKMDISNLKVSGMKVRTSSKVNTKSSSSFPK